MNKLSNNMNNFLTNIIRSKYSLLLMIVFITVFAVAHTQSPLYSSNQNTYLLHGLANANLGFLSYDWMANTIDPFPLFSLIVSLTYSNAPELFFYIYYAIILGVFIFSIMGIVSKVWGINRSDLEYLTNFVVITCVGSAAIDLSKLMSGVAGQYILGPVFQPSVFGVFLLLSVYAFLAGKPFLSVIFLGVAANFHATYLLSAASLTLSYMTIIILDEKNYRKALSVGLLSLISVAPVVIYTFLSFTPTSIESIKQAQSILVDYRIPHHAKVDVWFGHETLIKLSIVGFALFVLRRSRIWLIILIPFLISITLTLIQVLTGSHFLALLFPWRISSFLIPLCSFLLAGGVVYYIFHKYIRIINKHRKEIRKLLFFVLVLSFISGIVIQIDKNESHSKAKFTPMMSFVTETISKDNIYLIPPRLQRFRLQTGARILVDEKTHPYKDVEVIDWYSRLQLANEFYSTGSKKQCQVLYEISHRYGVTHVVSEEKKMLNCDLLNEIFNDGIYYVYKIKDIN